MNVWSLGFALGYSPAAQDARLRNILEIAEGRETVELDFPIVFKSCSDLHGISELRLRSSSRGR